MSSFARLFAPVLFAPAVAFAEAPTVVTDIAPVQSLVANVMRGVGTAEMLIRPGTSPHDYAMRPSEARALQDADLVIWIGPELTPQLEETLETLAGKAVHLELLDVENTRHLEFREGAVFGHDDRDHEENADHDDHEDHADHADHADHDDHEDHKAGHDDHESHEDENEHAEHSHGHDHDGLDPHAWLDPVNAQIWVQAIAAQLSDMDPGNAAVYDSNAATFIADLQALTDQTEARLASLKDTRFVVFHDAYQYFETRFGLHLTGAILEGDAASPSAGRLRALHEELEHEQVQCIFTEPQFNPKIVAAVSGEGDIPVAELDPIGVDLKVGEALYPQLISRMAEQFATCLDKKG